MFRRRKSACSFGIRTDDVHCPVCGAQTNYKDLVRSGHDQSGRYCEIWNCTTCGVRFYEIYGIQDERGVGLHAPGKTIRDPNGIPTYISDYGRRESGAICPFCGRRMMLGNARAVKTRRGEREEYLCPYCGGSFATTTVAGQIRYDLSRGSGRRRHEAPSHPYIMITHPAGYGSTVRDLAIAGTSSALRDMQLTSADWQGYYILTDGSVILCEYGFNSAWLDSRIVGEVSVRRFGGEGEKMGSWAFAFSSGDTFGDFERSAMATFGGAAIDSRISSESNRHILDRAFVDGDRDAMDYVIREVYQ